MEHPAFQNKVFLSIYILIWTVIALAISLAISPLVSFSFEFCLLFGAASGYIFGGIALVLWNVVKYADYASQNGLQRVVSYLALAVVSVGVWLGIIYFLLYLSVPENNISPFVPLIPLEIWLGICFFTTVVLAYNRMLEKNKVAEEEEELQEIEHTVTRQNPDPAIEIVERIAVKIGQKIEVIPVPDIFVVQAEGDYVMIHTVKGHHMKEQTMKYFEEHLPFNQFVRVHRSYIVNVQVISKIELFEKQNQLLTLQNGMQIKTSATGYKLLKKTLNL
jgi:Response regulator of the LytR/AlgR family